MKRLTSDMDVVELFEETIAKYAGSKYGVAVSSCTNAIFLSLEYLKSINEIKEGDTITIPSRTYMSVPMTILNARLRVKFEDIKWTGIYKLEDIPIWDGATRFIKNMYMGGLHCLSFQYRKHLPLGRGGMILTDSKQAYDWLRCARFNGRTPGTIQSEDEFKIRGWNMYMLPEQAARGLTMFKTILDDNPDCACDKDYPDLSRQEIFKNG